MEGKITLKSGITISYDSCVIDHNRGMVIMVCRFEECDNRIYFNKSQKEQLIKDDTFALQLGNDVYEVILKYAANSHTQYDSNQNPSLRSMQFVIECSAKMLIENTSMKNEKRIMYYIPCKPQQKLVFSDIYISKDKSQSCLCVSPLNIKGHDWKISKAYSQSNQVLPFDMIDAMQPHCEVGYLIETNTNNGIDLDAANKMVGHICCLLSFACGVELKWVSSFAWLDEATTKLIGMNGSSEVQTDYNFKPVIISSGDFYNPADLVIRAEESYFCDPEWWRITIGWFIHRQQSNEIALQKLIEGMLFDRLKRQILMLCLSDEQRGTVSVDNTFATIVKNNLNNISPGVSDSEKALEKLLLEWRAPQDATHGEKGSNYVPSICSLIEYAGGTVDGVLREDIKKRNRFVHNGDARIVDGVNTMEQVNTVVDFDTRVSNMCFSLILAAIGYDGYFCTNFGVASVPSLLSSHSLLNFSQIRTIAPNVVK